MIKWVTLCAAGLLASCATKPQVADAPAPDFWQQPALDRRMEGAGIDRALMATAIFHETNRVRENLGLRRFQVVPKLGEAADLEAAVGKVYQPPSHTNPFPRIGTPLERVKFVGLKPGQVAENIALLPVYDIELTTGVGVTTREGRRIFIHPLTQEELQVLTYRGFAALVVRAWMESPGHRANIVNPALRYLGCSVQPTISLLGVNQLFCVQVFFTPL